MREREIERDPYWNADIQSEILLPDGAAHARLQPHHSAEHYHGRNIAELNPLRQSTGMRRHVHAKSCVLELEMMLKVGASPTQRDLGVIGEVGDSPCKWMRHFEIGRAQA